MGTRGMIGFIMPDGAVLGTYNHHGSYPDRVGADLQKELRTVDSVAGLLPQVDAIRWVDASDEPTVEDQELLTKLGIEGQDVSTGRDWYSALRNNQGSLLAMLQTGIAPDDRNFLKDSLFCEWAYLLDFRFDEVVILTGFIRNPNKQADYCATEPSDSGYVGCMEVFRGDLPAFLALDMSKVEETAGEAD